MQNFHRYNQNEKAAVCARNNCVTVYGDTARLVNGIAITAAILIAVALLEKAFQ
jgi:hypothetical protein